MKRNFLVTASVLRKEAVKASIRAALADGNLTLNIYGNIGESFFGDGVTVQDIAEQLALNAQAKSITVRINSPGGDCFQGISIYNVLREQSTLYNRPVSVIVDGVAASAASIIAMAGDTLLMGKGTMLMIHPAMMMCMGDSSEMRQCAELLEKVTGQMADIYAATTGKPKDELLGMMYAETWMTPEEAIKQGFADGTTDSEGQAKDVAANFDLSVFNNVPEDLKVFAADNAAEEEQKRDRIRIALRKRMFEDLV